MELKDLVGYQLVKIDDDKIIVSKGNKTYVLNIEEDYGDCCGYNNIKTEMFFEENSKNNPIITRIEKKQIGLEDDGERVEITFFGENKELAKIDSLSSSGSGWSYGACVIVKCKELNIEEEITSW